MALALVPGTLVPMIFATLLVAFGHPIEHWMIQNADHELRSYVLVFGEWPDGCSPCSTSVAVLGVIYHFGTPHKRPWKQVVPGALMATVRGSWRH